MTSNHSHLYGQVFNSLIVNPVWVPKPDVRKRLKQGLVTSICLYICLWQVFVLIHVLLCCSILVAHISKNCLLENEISEKVKNYHKFLSAYIAINEYDPGTSEHSIERKSCSASVVFGFITPNLNFVTGCH